MLNEETMVVALLHDVVEDTNYSMSEISVKGVDHMRKYESQDAIIRDMNIAIKSDLSDNAKEALLHSLSWAFTEFHGKIRGCRYWSEAATAVYRELERKMASASELNKELSRELRHEHVVPRNIFVKSVIQGRKELKIEDLREKLLGCVVTRAEAETLDKHYKKTHPQGDDFFEIHDAWARYHECGIKYRDSYYYPIKIIDFNWVKQRQEALLFTIFGIENREIPSHTISILKISVRRINIFN